METMDLPVRSTPELERLRDWIDGELALRRSTITSAALPIGRAPMMGEAAGDSRSLRAAVEERAGVLHRAGALTIDNIDDAFTYQRWLPDQIEDGAQVREALVAAGKAILRNVPDTPLRTRALNCLVDCRMLANAAITHGGRF